MVDEEMKTAIAGGGALLSLAAIAYFGLKRVVDIGKAVSDDPRYILTLEATKGGTTEPEPGTYAGDDPVEVIVSAIVSEGYEFDGWYITGERVSTELTYTVNVTEHVLLIASFKEIGAPVLIPAYIKPIQNARAEDWWKTWLEDSALGQILHIGKDWRRADYVKFKICDQAGNGVPDQDIAVYADAMPDVTDYGFVIVNGHIATQSSPVILKSDADGVVSVRVEYWWQEAGDYQSTIGQAGKIETATYFGISCGWQYPIWEGWLAAFPCVYIRYFVRVKHPIFRTMSAIHAYWVQPESTCAGRLLCRLYAKD